MTFAKAKQVVASAGLEFEVSTTVGTALQQGDCVVSNQAMRSAVAFGREYKGSKLLLSLNCNDTVASAGHPGNSAASPEGREAKKEQAKVEWLSTTADGQAWCAQALVEHADWFPIEGCPS
jgi:thiamine monophosphate kinase